MKYLKKVGLLTLTCIFCFSLFSFKSADLNENQLSNLNNFKEIKIANDFASGDQSQAAWVAAAGRLAVKAWQKSSREAVYAAVALWPIMQAKENLIGIEIGDNLIQESKLSKL